MFAKTKARVEQFEETHENVREIHTHLVKYQLIYGMAASSIVTVLLMKGVGGKTIVPVTVSPPVTVAPVFNNTPHIAPVMTQSVINNGSYMRKIIRCLETDEMWPSMKQAAEATGNTIHKMSRHCNGYMDELQGLHYVIEGLASG